MFSSLIFSNIFNSFEIHLIFNSSKSHAPFLMCSIFHILNHSINFKNFVVMMSVSWRCFLNGVSIGHEIWTTDIVLDNNYWKTFAWFGRLIPKPPFLLYRPNATEKQTMMSLRLFTILNMLRETINYDVYNLLKTDRSHYIAILSVLQKGLV